MKVIIYLVVFVLFTSVGYAETIREYKKTVDTASLISELGIAGYDVIKDSDADTVDGCICIYDKDVKLILDATLNGEQITDVDNVVNSHTP